MLADADLVSVSLPVSATSMVVEVARGAHAEHFTGRVFDVVGSVTGRAFDEGVPAQSDSESLGRVDPDITFGPIMALPLVVSDEPLGVLTVTRLPGRARFSVADLDMAGEFAAQASVALRLVAAQLDRERLALLDDRGRIARDLHDHVIQRLFGAGLGLQAIARTVADPAVRARIEGQVDALDGAIADIRTAIFAMTAVSDVKRPAVRRRIIDLLAENSGGSGEPPRLTFSGPVDLLVPPAMVDDIVAVVREGLTNVTRHASAAQTRVSVSVVDSSVVIEIEDDGVGIDPARAGVASGTDNLATRAAAWGGSMSLQRGDPSGTVLTWQAPLDGSAAA